MTYEKPMTVEVTFFRETGKYYDTEHIGFNIVFDSKSPSGIDYYQTRENLTAALAEQVPGYAKSLTAVVCDCEWLGYPYLRQSDTWTAHRDEILDTLEAV